jgi:hypothetical protein
MLPGALREPVVSTPDGSIVRPARDARGATVALRETGIYSLYDGSVRGAPLRVLAANAPAAESDLTPLAPSELLLGTTQASATVGPGAPVQPPDVAERRQGFWRLLLGALALLLLGEMIFANRGWRGSATHLTLAPSERRGP